MKTMHGRLVAVLGAAALLGLVSQARAISFGFQNITHNGPADIAGQLSVEIIDNGAGQVQFVFSNNGPVGSSIAGIYFDDGTLFSVYSILDNPSATDFKELTGKNDLPGGNSLSPKFSSTFKFGVAGNNSTGINPGESVGIVFNLQAGEAYDDTVHAIYSGDLRIGLHVRSIAANNGDSDSFVNKVADGGATALLLGFVLLGVEGLRRKIKK